MLLLALAALAPSSVRAGPPYLTDDPETVEHRHWELYLATVNDHQAGTGWDGALPLLEGNYGVVPNVQLHLVVPLAYAGPVGAAMTYGLGDVEVGVKFRFVQEGDWVPMVGVFPIVTLPTGDAARGLGSGRTNVFLPVWLQKSFGPWTTYGGGGYWIDSTPGERNHWFFGWQGQRRFGDLTVGAEVFHASARDVGGAGDTRFDVGAGIDLSDRHHLLLSGGTRLGTPFAAQFYAGYQFTFGPEGEER
jgi:hypothetical protein